MEISYHDSVEEALHMIAVYENADGVEGIYVPDTYDWKEVE